MDLNKDIKDIHVNINSSTFNILYRKYKEFILPLIIIFAAIILFFIVIMPQIRSVLDQREQAKIEQQKLAQLNNNYNTLSRMDEANLDSNLTTLSRALPFTKDFAGIIGSITDNALNSGVVVNDFSFSVGDITDISTTLTAFPSIEITLSVKGSPKSVLNFIQALYKSAPLAEVTAISSSERSSSLTLLFYYKAFPKGQVSDESLVTPLTPKDLSTIDEISSWSLNGNVELFPVATPSAQDNIPLPEASASAGETNL